MASLGRQIPVALAASRQRVKFAMNDADCSGTMTFAFPNRPASETHWDLYVTEDGRAGHIIRMDDGAMAVRSFEK